MTTTTTTIKLVSTLMTVEYKSDGTRVTSTHINERHARVYLARRAFELAGWDLRPAGAGEGFRLPLQYPDERMMQPLDAARPRAHGFTASKGGTQVQLDTSGDLPALVRCEGDTEEAQEGLNILAAAGVIDG